MRTRDAHSTPLLAKLRRLGLLDGRAQPVPRAQLVYQSSQAGSMSEALLSSSTSIQSKSSIQKRRCRQKPEHSISVRNGGRLGAAWQSGHCSGEAEKQPSGTMIRPVS